MGSHLPVGGRALLAALVVAFGVALSVTAQQQPGAPADPLLATNGSAGRANSPESASTVAIDHVAGAVIITSRMPLDVAQSFPAARAAASRLATAEAERLYLDAVLAVVIDSATTVGEAARADSALLDALAAHARTPRVERTALAPGMRILASEYRYPLVGADGIIGLFVRHTRLAEPAPVLGFQPARPFTGLVVYAQGSYPVHGESEPQAARAALLPKLYDDQLRLVAAPAMAEPDALRRWGFAAYATDIDEEPYRERIGLFPLRTIARGLYGSNATDLIIADEAARTLLAEPANRRLIREGRILIIIDPPSPAGQPGNGAPRDTGQPVAAVGQP